MNNCWFNRPHVFCIFYHLIFWLILWDMNSKVMFGKVFMILLDDITKDLDIRFERDMCISAKTQKLVEMFWHHFSLPNTDADTWTLYISVIRAVRYVNCVKPKGVLPATSSSCIHLLSWWSVLFLCRLSLHTCPMAMCVGERARKRERERAKERWMRCSE